MSIRLCHKGARIVIVVRRGGAGVESWWSPHFAPRDWAPIFQDRLELLALSPLPDGDSAMACRLGRIVWTNSRCWSRITVQFERGTDVKRTLVAAALLKAARYG
jgi:hypothetical protein